MGPQKLLLTAVALLSAVACGVSVESFPSASAKTVCKKIYECCNAGEVSGNTFYGPDQAACEKNVAQSLDQTSQINTGVSKGRLAYSGDKVAECHKQYAALTCDQLKSNATSSTPACDAYLDPKVSAGGACGFDKECIGGSCEGETFGGDGVCRPFLAENIGCDDGGVCGTGLFCEGSSAQCRRLRADGANCVTNAECATGGCNGRNPDAGTSGTCGLKGGAGTTCYATSGCSVAGPGSFGVLAALVLVVVGLRRRPKR